MEASPFRKFLENIWRENCREHEEFGQLPYSLQEYWNRYKYWLKREYRHQNSAKIQQK
jgi:hypothetical protein